MDEPGDLAPLQHAVITAAQALDMGLTRDQVRHRVRRASWQRLGPGVYLTHSGEVDLLARIWAAVLRGGPTAVASHRTAGWLQGLVDEEPGVIDVTLAEAARGRSGPGVRVHRSTTVDLKRHPAQLPPRTRVEETVLDLVGDARRPDDVVSWVLRACQRRLTTPARLAQAAASRGRLAHRSLLLELVDRAADGVASPLEHRYHRDVERAHGLPAAERGGAWFAADGRRRYFDVRYARWRVRVELEGLAFHPAERSWVDHARDNAAVQAGDVVLRYGWLAVVREPATAAAQVAAVLTLRGWLEAPTPCGPGCPAGRIAPSDNRRHR